MSTATITVKTAKHDWREDPAGPKQRYWIEKCMTERKLGIALTDQATAALADPELTKGAAGELLDKLFNAPKVEVHKVPQGIYLHDGSVYLVRPNKKQEQDPTQQGAGFYSMALVPAPQAGNVRLVLVFDPEARTSLTDTERVSLEDIADDLPKCTSSARKALTTWGA